MERNGMIAPKRAAPKDDPRRKLRRIAAAVAYGGMDEDEAAHRLAQVLAAARTDAERKGWARDFRATVRSRRSPPDTVEQAAGAVKWYMRECGYPASGRGGFNVHDFAGANIPQWIEYSQARDLYVPLYFQSLILGWSGRTFGLAKNKTGKAYGMRARGVETFAALAKHRGFLIELERRTVEDMIPYVLAEEHENDVEWHALLFGYVRRNLKWLFHSVIADGERERLAHEVLSRAYAHIRAHA